jgi:hypothetical protein
MNLQPELHVELIALRQAEIRREVAGDHLARQAWRARAMAGTPHRLWRPVLQLGAMLAHAVCGTPGLRVA